MARSSSKTRQSRPSHSNTNSEDIEMDSHNNVSTSAVEKPNGDNSLSAKKKTKGSESSTRESAAASSSKRVSTARPLSKQVEAPAAGNVRSSDTVEVVNSDNTEPRKRSELKRHHDIDGLRAELKTATEEAKHWKDESTRHRKKNDDLLKEIGIQGDMQNLKDENDDLKLRIQQKDAQIEKLTQMAALVGRLTRDKKPSELKYITHAVALEDRRSVEGELKRLQKLLDEANVAQEQAEEEKKARQVEYDQKLASLNTTVADLQNELKMEIARQKQINKPTSRTGKANAAGDEMQEVVTHMYQDLTNFLVRSGKTEMDPDTGRLRWVFQCMCSGAKTEWGNGRSINFTFLLFNNPDDPDDNAFHQCKYIPLDLEKEPDEAEFCAHLDFLSEPFTFARDQMDIFFTTLSERLKAPRIPDADADEDGDVILAEDANQSQATQDDMTVDSVPAAE